MEAGNAKMRTDAPEPDAGFYPKPGMRQPHAWINFRVNTATALLQQLRCDFMTLFSICQPYLPFLDQTIQPHAALPQAG